MSRAQPNDAGPGPAEGAPILELHGVSQAFGGVVAVSDVTAAFPTGQITGLIGPNGAGKSTLLNLVAGTLRCRTGRILFAGERVERWPAHARARKGLARTFQLSSEFKRLTVIENLVCGTRLGRGETLRGAVLGSWWWGGDERRAIERATGILEQFGLTAKGDQLAGTLSGGERRLVEVGRALMGSPKLLLLDEPLAGVHPRNVGRIIDAVKGLKASGISVLACLHEPDAVERLCDGVVVMSQGVVIATGAFDAVRKESDVLAAYLGA